MRARIDPSKIAAVCGVGSLILLKTGVSAVQDRRATLRHTELIGQDATAYGVSMLILATIFVSVGVYFIWKRNS